MDGLIAATMAKAIAMGGDWGKEELSAVSI
jgi:hypothetical protein